MRMLAEHQKVRYFYGWTDCSPKGRPLPQSSRYTMAVIYEPGLDGEERAVASGYVVCGPNDQFAKRIGRAGSLGRALKSLEHARAVGLTAALEDVTVQRLVAWREQTGAR